MINDLKAILYTGLFVVAFLGVSMLFIGQINPIIDESLAGNTLTDTYHQIINDVVGAFSNTPLVVKIGILAIVIGMLFKLVTVVTGGGE